MTCAWYYKQYSKVKVGKGENLKTVGHQEDCQWQKGLERINPKEEEKDIKSK